MFRNFPSGPPVKTLPSNAGDTGLNPGWGAKIPDAEQHDQKNKTHTHAKLKSGQEERCSVYVPGTLGWLLRP